MKPATIFADMYPTELEFAGIDPATVRPVKLGDKWMRQPDRADA